MIHAASVPSVVHAVPVPGGPAFEAGQRLAQAQQRVDTMHLEIDERLEQLGEAGITRPRDVLLLVKELKNKEGKGMQLSGACMFCNASITSTGATRFVDHILDCPLVPARIRQPVRLLRDTLCSLLDNYIKTKTAAATGHRPYTSGHPKH